MPRDARLRPPTGVSVADVAGRSGRSSAAPGRGSRPRCSRDGRATLRWPIARPIDHLFAAQRQTSAARSACAKSGPERALRCLEGRVSSGGTDWATVIARAPMRTAQARAFVTRPHAPRREYQCTNAPTHTPAHRGRPSKWCAMHHLAARPLRPAQRAAAAAAAGAEEGRPPTVQGEGRHESHLCRR